MRTIAHLSDLHFGTVDPTIAEALIADISTPNKPDVLVVSGDFTQRARVSQFKAARAYLDRLPTPQILVPGNHDIPLYDVLARFLFPRTRYQQYITTDLAPTYQDEELYIAGVDTSRSLTLKDGRISEEQFTALKTRFCAANPNLFKILVAHHPFVPIPGAHEDTIVGRALETLTVLESCALDLILSGHMHADYAGDLRTHHETIKQSTLVIQAGTATSSRRRNQPNAWNRITINPPELFLETRAWADNKWTRAQLHTYRKDLQGWTRTA